MSRSEKERKSHAIRWIVLLLIIVFLLSWWQGWIPGLGSGKDFVQSKLGGSSTETVQTTAAEQVEKPQIEIKGEQVLFNGEEILVQDLTQKLQGVKEVKLVENNAVKATYDSVTKVLNELGIKF